MGKVKEQEQLKKEWLEDTHIPYTGEGNPLQAISKDVARKVSPDMRSMYFKAKGVYGNDKEVFDWYYTPTTTNTACSTQVGGTHYQIPIQPIEFIVKNNIPYIEGNIIKYVVRHKKKNGKEDLLKARHYIDMLLEEYK